MCTDPNKLNAWQQKILSALEATLILFSSVAQFAYFFQITVSVLFSFFQ